MGSGSRFRVTPAGPPALNGPDGRGARLSSNPPTTEPIPMRSFVLLPIIASGIIAQGPPQEPKIPRPQAVGRAEKVTEVLPAKPVVDPMGDSTQTPATRPHQRTLTTKEQAIADA